MGFSRQEYWSSLPFPSPVDHVLSDNAKKCFSVSFVVQSLSCVWFFATPWTTAHQVSLSFTISLSLLKLMSIELVMPSNHLNAISVFPSIRVFSSKLALHIRWPKFWSFSFSIDPFNEHSGLISFRIGWFDLVAVQATLKSLLQHHCSKPWILQHSAFFMVQLLHSYMTTGKTTAMTTWTFVSKVTKVTLLFNILSRFITAFLPSSKHLVISWLQSP